MSIPYSNVDPTHAISVINSFYHRMNDYNEFKDITESRMQELEERANKIATQLNTPSRKNDYQSKYDQYIQCIDHIRKETISLDEKMILIILTFDPELVTYKTISKAKIVSKKDIENEKDGYYREELIKQRKHQIEDMEMAIRQKVGFYDKNLFLFEKKFYRFRNIGKDLVKNVDMNLSPTLYNSIGNENDIVLSDQEIQSIQELVKKVYKDSTPSYNDVIYHVVCQNDQLNLTSELAKIYYVIQAIDPGFQALEIYNQESQWKKVILRLNYTLNIKDKHLVYFELYYLRKQSLINEPSFYDIDTDIKKRIVK